MTNYQPNPPQSLLDSYGCTIEFWRRLREIGIEQVKAGGSKDSTPLRAFSHQRGTAINRRKIGWELTLPQWWAIWQVSGRWNERGWGRGYQMCRKGDTGPYAMGNVYIGPGALNLSAASKKELLPIGVARIKKGKAKPYRAICWVHGKQRHLGCFATVADAQQAYRDALEIDLAGRGKASNQNFATLELRGIVR